MALIIKPNGTKRKAKNLGWLVRNAHHVRFIEVSPQGHFIDPRKGFEMRMIATLADGTRYITDWASREVCRQWVAARKVFKRSLQGDRWGFIDIWIHSDLKAQSV